MMDRVGIPNKLIKEKSPYLLQHAYNPVDWYPWGDDAFQKAKIEDRPIFLSIGYATCHWCHVMAHESFEDEKVAELMNETFVNIKVDREERPDIDAIYMSVCQMMTGGGGWPLTIIMTPDKKPFYAATYIPKESKFGRMGLLDLIAIIKDKWEKEKTKIIKSADDITESIKTFSNEGPGEDFNKEISDSALNQFISSFDEKYGGFGRAPKFPSPHNFLFLLRYYNRTKNKQALDMVRKSLDEMLLGGIFDHIGYGFHRYSTDRFWRLPHFEKMLYDQAMLIMAYTEGYLVTKKDDYKYTVEKIIDYILRVMKSKEGGFFSAEDADSEGEEGKFYVWSIKEIREVLNKEESDIIEKVYNLSEEGNFEDEATGRRLGVNIFYQNQTLDKLREELQLEDIEKRLEKIREKLFNEREKREKPLLDDKILVDWNGLMIAALSKAYMVLGNEKYIQAATDATEFILGGLDKNKRLFHMYREGQWKVYGNLDDYAFMIWGIIELYEATFEIRYLETALKLSEDAFKYFADYDRGGFYFTPNDNEELLIRNKEIYDGAIPSGNSVMMLNLLRLARITGRTELEDSAFGIYRAFSKSIKSMPMGYSFLLCGVEFAIGEGLEIVIVGDKSANETKNIVKIINEKFLPNKVMLLKPIDEKEAQRVHNLAEYTLNQNLINDKTTVYICKNFVCNNPTNKPEEVKRLIN
ncbi:hypothetical protein ABG79_02011 [Caloramator mitchellensis]|uniref:Spermatogenesis-associated protein 20-like TRX domain-containing protein n=1 Tax=Caloramator mitchellensis TaxID=908809 RepID=A0A0R3JT44_CALMK|nr:thioredoxin domain-containing protein [Caloramator mitchellensis]KRQ86170.1 hypothetical protein ABG79_02011 [Caloramator mitchellensis]